MIRESRGIVEKVDLLLKRCERLEPVDLIQDKMTLVEYPCFPRVSRLDNSAVVQPKTNVYNTVWLCKM